MSKASSAKCIYLLGNLMRGSGKRSSQQGGSRDVKNYSMFGGTSMESEVKLLGDIVLSHGQLRSIGFEEQAARGSIQE